ncbi:MAG: hypothetical protein ISP49_12515 [Reyranella sp.]|jgi:hypothetical protein|nr:hypothetical protein [Reyranella sp.]MBL6652413.1 hypothetical protein [Reyranella sp.]
MRSGPFWRRLKACARGSMLVGYSSLALLVALAAIMLLAPHDVGLGGGRLRPAIGPGSAD